MSGSARAPRTSEGLRWLLLGLILALISSAVTLTLSWATVPLTYSYVFHVFVLPLAGVSLLTAAFAVGVPGMFGVWEGRHETGASHAQAVRRASQAAWVVLGCVGVATVLGLVLGFVPLGLQAGELSRAFPGDAGARPVSLLDCQRPGHERDKRVGGRSSFTRCPCRIRFHPANRPRGGARSLALDGFRRPMGHRLCGGIGPAERWDSSAERRICRSVSPSALATPIAVSIDH